MTKYPPALDVFGALTDGVWVWLPLQREKPRRPLYFERDITEAEVYSVVGVSGGRPDLVLAWTEHRGVSWWVGDQKRPLLGPTTHAAFLSHASEVEGPWAAGFSFDGLFGAFLRPSVDWRLSGWVAKSGGEVLCHLAESSVVEFRQGLWLGNGRIRTQIEPIPSR